jgi:hypothetical protein
MRKTACDRFSRFRTADRAVAGPARHAAFFTFSRAAARRFPLRQKAPTKSHWSFYHVFRQKATPVFKLLFRAGPKKAKKHANADMAELADAHGSAPVTSVKKAAAK